MREERDVWEEGEREVENDASKTQIESNQSYTEKNCLLHTIHVYTHLLSRMADSTEISEHLGPRDFWLIADKKHKMNLVDSVFPAPLSPLHGDQEVTQCHMMFKPL